MNSRKIHEIAYEISKDEAWKKAKIKGSVFGAVPYLDAMKYLTDKDSKYGCDDAESVCLYFLSNASYYRGDVARKVKAEIKQIFGFKS